MNKITLYVTFCFTLLPIILMAQGYEKHLYGKKWYAIKAFYGRAGETNSTDFICEDDCTTGQKTYLFYFKTDRRTGLVTDTDKKFRNRKPVRLQVTNESLFFHFSSDNSNDKIEFKILLLSDDFLQIEGPENDIYFLVSDNKNE